MTIPTAEQLETTFLQAGQIRLRNPKYSNDSTYWIGGHCNWGGNHNLKEDCQQLVKGFGKLASLDQIGEELKRCTNKSEFDSKKATYLMKCDELTRQLDNRSTTSYAFNICCIWSQDNMGQNIQRMFDQAKAGINNDIKSSLNNHSYQAVEEINQINLEINQISERMRENQQKATRETDPAKKLALIALIENDGKLLIQKQNQLARLENRLNFDASSYVRNIIESMIDAIKGSSNSSGGNNSGGGGGSGSDGQPPHNPNKRPTNHFTPNNLPNNDTVPNNTNSNNDNQPTSQGNQQLFLIIGAVVILFILMNKQSNHEEY